MAESSSQSQSQTPAMNPNVFAIGGTSSNSSHGFHTPKLTIKLDDKNFLMWNQQVTGIITSYKLHRLLVNPTIPAQYTTEADRIAENLSDEYERWLVQDQMVFTWLLSTLSDAVLPRVLTCKHAHQVGSHP